MPLRLPRLAFLPIVASLALSLAAADTSHAASPPSAPGVRLAGHVLPLVTNGATTDKRAPSADAGAAPIALTIVLRRDDPAGFDAYLHDVNDAQSASFRKFLPPVAVSDRYGPSADDYGAVAGYFRAQGFSVRETSANRMTLVVEGTRGLAEKALGVTIRDYTIGARRFYANDADPLLPPDVASRVQSVVGLASLARPEPTFGAVGINFWCSIGAIQAFLANIITDGYKAYHDAETLCRKAVISQGGFWIWLWQVKDPPPPAWQGVDGTGQKIGIVAFNDFALSDVGDFLNLLGLPPSLLGHVSKVHVAGGAPSSATSDETETLLDVDVALATARGAQIAVYDAPFTGAGTFQAIFNAMIGDGVTVISNSFAYCENQTTAADVESIDAIVQAAAASGISVISASGDRGSTCLDGAPNTVHVPADVPHVTAVGGTSAHAGPGGLYASETWWDGTADSPPTGQGGFGVSAYFSRPAYQDALNAGAMRSVPDLALDADPATRGLEICQADAGGCPTGLFYGGTSVSAPLWAAYVALLNQSQGANLGFLNPALYGLSGTTAFHSPASMGSDFAHVGLGSPNVNEIHRRLTGQAAGLPDPTISQISAYYGTDRFPFTDGMALPADGESTITVVVRLSDGLGNFVGGKTVSLTAPGSSAVIAPATAVTDPTTGAAVFTVKDATVESLTLQATDVTDGIVLAQTIGVVAVVPPAAAGGITAGPSPVANDGTSTTTITVTLRDVHDNPTPGKQVTLMQGNGHSVISGPTPSVTDASGTIQFTATDQTPETVTYTAIDVTDGNLPVPGSASVTFSGQASTSCVSGPPVAAAGFTLTPFSTGYFAQDFFFGNVNWGGCPGASNPAFNTDGSSLVADFRTGDVFELGPAGGAASSGNKLSNLGLTLGGPTFGKGGHLYASHGATTGNFTTGDIVEIDPATGAQLRVVAANLTCPTFAIDPLSGDIFFDDTCFGAGSDNPTLWRIHDPAGTPVVTAYATLPTTPNGRIAFAPDGTMYVSVGYTSATPQLVQVTGTDKPMPATVTVVPGIAPIFWVTMGAANPDGSAKSLIVLESAGLNLIDITTSPFTRTALTTVQSIGSGVIGADGCLYASGSDTIYRLTSTSGDCGFVPTNPSPALALSPASVSPSPAQSTSLTFTASFSNVSVPAGTPVTFTVVGANTQTRLGNTDATGKATMSYVGQFTGSDTVRAIATVGADTLTSNFASITWVAGRHATLVSLGGAPSTGTAGQPTTVSATLADISQNPTSAVAGVTIQFMLGAQSCTGSTSAKGVASCTLTAGTGPLVLTATFAGNGAYAPSSATQRFNALAAEGGGTPPGAPTDVAASDAGDGVISVAFTPPADDGGSAITGYVATCTPTSGAPIVGTGSGSPIAVFGGVSGLSYACTVVAANVDGNGPPSSPSNAVVLASSAATATPVPALARSLVMMVALLVAVFGASAMRRAHGAARR